ncbi:MAG: DUF1800 domain-containing protein [Pseudomonadota bacterium]
MKLIVRVIALTATLLLAACFSVSSDSDAPVVATVDDSSSQDSGDGGVSGGGSSAENTQEISSTPPVYYSVDTQEAVKFLNQASFGGSPEDIVSLEAQGLEEWIYEQTQLPLLPYSDRLIDATAYQPFWQDIEQALFWERAIHADDQLRQRMMFALSQIVVASLSERAVRDQRISYGTYIDILQRHALGNYCDLVREVSFNPIMGIYLTHLGNRKADTVSGFVPDENYAREVMQLFTIGLEVLNGDGTGQGIETYTLDDVQGLASIFTGLSWADTNFEYPSVTDNNRYLPMESYVAQHEDGPKSFLGTTIDLGNDAVVSVNAALDFLLTHPNVAPFISKQLIQKLVTSNPSPGYVTRVAAAFTAGTYTLPDGKTVGEGRRCDMAATAAAILLDEEARGDPPNENFGKLRSPVLRLAQYFRAFRTDRQLTTSGAIPRVHELSRLEDVGSFGHNAFYSPSVFNFFRPDYVAPGTESSDADLLTPEFQIATTPGLIGYINTMETIINGFILDDGSEYIDQDFYIDLAEDATELVDALDLLLTGGTLSDANKQRIIAAVDLYDQTDLGVYPYRLEMALMLIVVSPEYMVQR